MENKIILSMKESDRFHVRLTSPTAGTTDYEKLHNLPEINGIPLVGDLTAIDLRIVSENTLEGWDEDRLYVPKAGEICIYTDTAQIKIGDGEVPITDLPFIGKSDYDKLLQELHEHVNDTSTHVSKQDRDFWDNKLNYQIVDDELILTRQ